MTEAGPRPKLRWIVALSGMLVVPIVGLVWAAVSGGAPDVEAEGESAADEGDADEDATSTGSGGATKKKSKKKPRPRSKSSSRPSARKAKHEASDCCEALRKGGREESDVSKRPTLLAAASACEAAPTAERALAQVKSIVEGARVELPSECAD